MCEGPLPPKRTVTFLGTSETGSMGALGDKGKKAKSAFFGPVAIPKDGTTLRRRGHYLDRLGLTFLRNWGGGRHCRGTGLGEAWGGPFL